MPTGDGPLRHDWGEDPAANPKILAELHSVFLATQRLWRDLHAGPLGFIPEHSRHSRRVGLFSLKIARALKLSDELCQQVYRAAYLHDVGKIALPSSILRSTSVFTTDERRAMQVHSLMSRELLGAFLPTRDLAEIAATHHERYDGNGYPHGLQAARIPLPSRVLAIADSLDAMLKKSTGRTARSYSAAWEEVIKEAGRQFDPGIVEQLMRTGKVRRHLPAIGRQGRGGRL